MQVCKCVKMTKKNEENLLSHICIPGGIFFKFGRGLQCMEANSTINSGKTSWSYRCMKIVTLLFVSNTHSICVSPILSGCLTHYRVS